ncbi:MAG: major capsid protein [Desulfovibrionaceae bacterium]
MSLIIDLQTYFTAAKIAKVLETAPAIESTVFDMLFPEGVREQYESPVIPLSEIQTVVTCLPVVQRGAESVPLHATSMDNQYIEPLPLRVNSPLRAVDLNNLKLMGMGDKSVWVARKTLAMRRAIKMSIEAMCAQAIFDGAIDYPLLQASGQYARYKVTYNGTIATQAVAAVEKWDHADATLATVFLLLEDMASAQDKAGYGGTKAIFAGRLAYVQLLKLIEGTDRPKIPVRVNEDGSINLGGHTIRKMAETYKDPATGTATAKVPDKEIRMVSKGYSGFFYGPVDDLEANLRPMPMFVKPIELRDPSEIRIVAESKPLPAVAAQATRKAVVLA